MKNERRQTKRTMALLPEEESVLVHEDSGQYAARLVNISSAGALVTVNGYLQSECGDRCKIFFGDGDKMFSVRGELVRQIGRYAAFRFVELTADTLGEILGKVERMEELSSALCSSL